MTRHGVSSTGLSNYDAPSLHVMASWPSPGQIIVSQATVQDTLAVAARPVDARIGHLTL
jgi:hypothetical protein